MTRASFKNLLSIRSLAAALLALVAVAITPAALAQAPEPTASQPTELDTIEVTGSRIRQVDLETAQPVQFITRQDIDRQGFQNIADILQNMSSAGNPALSRASPLSAGENVGGSFISLRGVGAQRTLVLVNGKRLGISTSGFQDISVIPVAMVERIEVLKDGASAIYGSDAMGGVVNIITRSKHEGLEANLLYGVYDEGDGQIDKYDFVMGTTSARGGIVAGLEYAEEARVSAASREFSAYPQGALHPTRGWTTVGQFGGFVSTTTTPGVTCPTPTTCPRILSDPNNPAADPRLISSYIPQDQTTGSAPATREGLTLHKSNTNQQTDLHTPLQRKSLFLAGNYEIADDMRFLADVAYTDRAASRQVAGYPYQSLVFNTPMSIDSYFNPLGNQSTAPTKQAINNWWRRAWEVPRVSVSELDILRLTGGFQGGFTTMGKFFNWNSDVMYSSNNVIQSSYGNLNVANVRSAVGPSFLNGAGRVQCGTAVAPIDFSNCVPWNPFAHAGQDVDGSLTGNQPLVDFLMQEEHSTGKTTTRILTTGITGLIVDLPAGPLAMAVALERREEAGAFTPDALAVTAGSTNLAARGTRGGYDANEIYGELAIPLVADVIAVDSLKASLAMRYSDYNVFGGVKRGKAMLEYRPIDEVLVRGTYAEGFRVPTISDLYAGGSQSFSFYTDPCDPIFGAAATNAATAARCDGDISNYPNTIPTAGYTDATPECTPTAPPSNYSPCFRQLGQGFVPAGGPNTQTPVAFFQGAGNPVLEPESSYSKTAGIVWTSSFVKDLTLGLDFWTVRINNTIVQDTPSQILTDCYTSNIAARCIGFTRDPAQGYVNTFSFGQRNAGYREHAGYDFDIKYIFKIGPWDELGNYTFNWMTTYIDKQVFKTTNAPTAPEANEIATASSAGAVHRIRSNANINWTLAAFGASFGARYYSRVSETCLSFTLFPGECSNIPQRTNDVGDITFFDAQFRYTAPWNGVLSVGANNLFDKVGPQMYSQPDANVSYNGEYDIDRFVYAKYLHKF